MTETAKAYGDTLYDLAVECGELERILNEVNAVRQSLEENPQFVTLMTTPTLKKQERVQIIEETFRGKVHRYLLNFMKIITENGTAYEFVDAAKEFRSRYNWEHGIEIVTVTTAVPLTAAQTKELIASLAKTTGKTIHLEQTVDPSLVGGVRLLMDGVQLDGTIKNKLDAIRSRLLGALA